jgi:hypothetical protein
MRSQWHHVIDVAPTILDAAGLPAPKMVNGTAQTPIQGVSMVYTFADAKARDRHTTQYFEIFGNRGIYSDGWLATTVHKAPWEAKPREPLRDDKWELYNTENDFSLVNDLAAKNPEKLKALQDLFMKEAAKNHALPIDDRSIERMNPALAGRPDLMGGRTSLTLFEGMVGMSENVFLNMKNTSHAITAEVEIPKGGANGVILAQAGRFGGWSLYMKGGKSIYTYNFLGLAQYKIASPEAAPAGKATIRYEFAYDGGGIGKGGKGTLFLNGKQVAQGRIDRTQCCVFSADEGVDVGEDRETNVTNDYREGDNKFTGEIAKVIVQIGETKLNHMEAQQIDTERAVKAQAQE